jgi:predicted MFS family arabinose efflux permease
MAAACGFAVSNLYYNQPLLPAMGASFGRSSADAGLIATLTQLGYAAGLFLFVPLGDKVDRKRLILFLLTLNILSLAATAFAPTFAMLSLASFAVGATAITAQIIIPAVSGSAAPAERGRVIGTLVSGLSSGLLFARTLSGLVGAHAGWRAMFAIAIVIDVGLMAIVWLGLSETEGKSKLPYPALLASLSTLLRNEPVLRAACVTGFLMFASFSALWSTLAVLLARQPYGFGSDVVGAFGFLGIAGLLASPVIGRAIDRFGPSRMLIGGVLALIAAFVLIAGATHHIILVAATIVLVDLGNRAGLIANQTRIYALSVEARSRLNTVLMTSNFLGGAIGAAVAAWATEHFAWLGLSVAGAGFALLAFVGHLATERRSVG